MRRSEAVELQRRVLELGLHQAGSPDFEPRGRGVAGPEEVFRPADELAIGIRGRADDFELAVRSWRDGEDIRAAVDAIRAEGGPLDFRVVGRIAALSKPWHQSKVRPLWPGCSAAHRRVGLGTAGCFVALREDAARWPHILSNNHVLAREREDLEPLPKDWIFQPADDDDDDLDDDTVARLSRWVPLQVENNLVDAAIARLDEGIAWQPEVLDGIGDLQGVRPANEPLVDGEPVHKVGRSTGTTNGWVKGQHFKPMWVDFPIRTRSFVDVFEIESGGDPFCDSGDSGSLVVDEQHRAVGLLFAKANDAGTAYANPIHHVLDLLDIELLLEVTN